MSSAGSEGEFALTVIASCGSSNCPTVYRSDRGTMVIQGVAVSAGSVGIELPDGEFLVEIPENILLEAAAARIAERSNS